MNKHSEQPSLPDPGDRPSHHDPHDAGESSGSASNPFAHISSAGHHHHTDDAPSHGPLSDRPSTISDSSQPYGYATFEMAEAAVVLSHYDLGVISAIREFRRGSRHSPKLLIKSQKGRFILKRRAHGRDDPVKVAFTHQIQRKLYKQGYPLPRIALTRDTRESMLSIGGRMYELFEFIRGENYDFSLHATFEAGQGLALFHKILAGVEPDWQPPGSGYHRSPHVAPNLDFIPHRLGDESIAQVCADLKEAYIRAAERAESAGFSEWPRQIIHGDWHPGNMLFRDSKVVAVIDYDTARVQPRALDIANGTLQFSITRNPDDPSTWPDEPDEGRLKRFCRGYDAAATDLISTRELEALPWLMMEAVIAEAALPIAAQGRFGRLPAIPFLQMVQRKVRWLESNCDRIARLVS